MPSNFAPPSEAELKSLQGSKPTAKEIEDFLTNIRTIESSKGRFTKGKTMSTGLHKGDSAIGDYQLMPKTINEFAKRSQDKELLSLSNLSPDEKYKYLINNPKTQDKIARMMANHVLTKSSGDFRKAAYMWNTGHNLEPDEIDEDTLNQAEYVQKFDKAYSRYIADLKKKNKQQRTLSSSKSKFAPPTPEELVALQQEDIKEPSQLKAAGLGALQGATFGFSDEAMAALKAMQEQIKTKVSPVEQLKSHAAGKSPEELKELYQKYRELERQKYKAAEEAFPGTYGTSELAGGIATSLIPGLGAGNVAKAAGLGALTGLGTSEADLTEGQVGGTAEDILMGGALGYGAGKLGEKIGQALTPEATKARAVARAVKAMGGKQTPENLRAGEAVLKEGILPFTGGGETILQAIKNKMTDIEKKEVQPIFKKISEVPDITERTKLLPEFAQKYSPSELKEMIKLRDRESIKLSKLKQKMIKELSIQKNMDNPEKTAMLKETIENLQKHIYDLDELTESDLEMLKRSEYSPLNKIAYDIKSQIPFSSTIESKMNTIDKTANVWRGKIYNAGKDPKQLNEVRILIDREIQELDKTAWTDPENLKPKVEFLKKLREELNTYLRKSASLISEGSGEELAKAMGRQSPLYTATDLATKLVEKDIEHPPGSILDIIRNPLTNPYAAGIGISTALVNKPLAAAGLATKIGIEKATKQPIERIGNIASARVQYGLSKALGAPIGKLAAQAAKATTERGLSSVGVQASLPNFYSMDNNQLNQVGDALMEDPVTNNIGKSLKQALSDNDKNAINKIVFVMKQRPDIRAKLSDNTMKTETEESQPEE